MKKNLVLTGMMGVGKSTVGKKLAKKLKLKFVDADRVIELKEKNTIKEIFKKKGEIYFRKVEKKIILEILKKTDLVVALGGGAFMSRTVRKEIKKSCVSFWLDVNLNYLLYRLKNVTKRPLLNQDNLEETIKKIYSERKKIYNESNFKVKSNAKDLTQTVNKIIDLYESTRN